MPDALASLVRNHGGEPLSFPAVREAPRSCTADVARLLDTFAPLSSPLFILSTGVGVTALFKEAETIGRKTELSALLVRSTRVARGPKPVSALRKEGLEASVVAAEPYTTNELIDALERLPVSGQPVVVLHYGEVNDALIERLRARDARLFELMLYEWRMPEDERPLEALVDLIARGEMGAVLFTSQIQARHLFEVAERLGRRDALVVGLTQRTVVGAVGPTTEAKLVELGVRPHVVPERPKMGPLVAELARHVSIRRA